MRPVARRVGILMAALAAAAALAPSADAARLHPVMSGLGEPTYVTGHGGNLYVALRRGVIRVRQAAAASSRARSSTSHGT